MKSDAAYDPFPKTGLVKDYEPFIRSWVADFCKQFPWVAYQDALNEAVLRATTAAQRFKPELGYDFSTYLRHYLKKLYAMQEEESGWSHAAPTDWAQDQEAAPKPIFPRGANGTRVAFDCWQWAGDDQRKGVVVGFRLRNTSVSYSIGVSDRISAALDMLRGDDS